MDPSGLRLRQEPNYSKKCKASIELPVGTLVRVRQRGPRDGMIWLELSDGHGWAFERTNRRRMSEVRYEPSEGEPEVLAIGPELLHGVKMQSTPHLNNDAHVVLLHAGTPVAVHRKANVILPAEKSAETDTLFLQIIDDVGNEGWIPARIGSKKSVVSFEMEQLGPEGTSLWICIMPGSSLPVYLAPGKSSQPLRVLASGDIVELAPERLHLDGLTFYRLVAGGWLCDKQEKGPAPFAWVARELHWWRYSCANRDGAVIRAMPTREKKHNTDRKLKQGQEVVCSEKVTYPDGDAFIRLEPPLSGWVPLGRKNGDVKMHPEREVPPGAGPAEGIQSVPSGPEVGKKASKGFGFGLGKKMSMAAQAMHFSKPKGKTTATDTE